MLEAFRKLEEILGKEATQELVGLFDLKLQEMESKLATKSDLEKVNATIERVNANVHKTESTMIKWFVGIVASGTLINLLLEHFM